MKKIKCDCVLCGRNREVEGDKYLLDIAVCDDCKRYFKLMKEKYIDDMGAKIDENI